MLPTSISVIISNKHTIALNVHYFFYFFRCLNISNIQSARGRRSRLKLSQNSKEWEFDIDCPAQYTNICKQNCNNPPSLFELSRRTLYRNLSDSSRNISSECYSIYTYSDRAYRTENNNVNHLQSDFNNFKITTKDVDNINRLKAKEFYMPGDIIAEHFDYLPSSIKEDLVNGPLSRCENAACKAPIFDYVYFEFTIGYV